MRRPRMQPPRAPPLSQYLQAHRYRHQRRPRAIARRPRLAEPAHRSLKPMNMTTLPSLEVMMLIVRAVFLIAAFVATAGRTDRLALGITRRETQRARDAPRSCRRNGDADR